MCRDGNVPTMSGSMSELATQRRGMAVASEANSMWTAIQTRTNREKLVANALPGKGYECFLPLRTVVGQRASSVRSYPLFPGYVFCRFDVRPSNALIVTTPGVMRLVGVAGVPARIPDVEIESLQRVVAANYCFESMPLIMPGQKVTITRGPLRSLEGTLCDVHGNACFTIRITLLQRSVSVRVPSEWVEAQDISQTDSLEMLAMRGQLLAFEANS